MRGRLVGTILVAGALLPAAASTRAVGNPDGRPLPFTEATC